MWAFSNCLFLSDTFLQACFQFILLSKDIQHMCAITVIVFQLEYKSQRLTGAHKATTCGQAGVCYACHYTAASWMVPSALPQGTTRMVLSSSSWHAHHSFLSSLLIDHLLQALCQIHTESTSDEFHLVALLGFG